MSDFDRQYQRGVIVEQKVKAWLLTRGYSVVNVRHGGDVAPTLARWDRRIMLPDLQAMRPNGQFMWVEVKAKTTCVVFEVRGVARTGIDLDKLREYRDVEALTGKPVYVVFVHEEQREIRVARVTDDWDQGIGRGAEMAYRDWLELPRFGSYDEVMAVPAALTYTLEAPLFVPEQEYVQLGLETA